MAIDVIDDVVIGMMALIGSRQWDIICGSRTSLSLISVQSVRICQSVIPLSSISKDIGLIKKTFVNERSHQFSGTVLLLPTSCCGKISQVRTLTETLQGLGFLMLLHFINHFGKFGPPYLGKATATARVAIPSPTAHTGSFRVSVMEHALSKQS